MNLASLLNDEDHWHIPTIGDSSPADIKTSANASTIASNPKMNMNSADVKLLETLPGIGEIRTKAMIGHRDANGPFPTMDDLLAVNSIGAATLESIRSLIEAR